MKILFLLANIRSPYEGVARPFINWAKELAKNNYEIHLVTIKCGTELIDFIRSMRSHKIKHEHAKSADSVVNYIKRIKPDIMITDDSIDRLKLATKIKNRAGIRTVIYIQTLFGVHSIVEVFDLKYLQFKEKLKYSIAKLIPFTILKRTYGGKLLKHNVLIANSKTTASLLSILYGIEPHGIVYPPVDTAIFRPYNLKKENKVLLYLGSHGGDTNEKLVRRICECLEKKRYETLVLGNKMLREKLTKRFNNIHVIEGVTDEELAKYYSKSKLTICPQVWEQFGYVVAESIACGTPVLAFGTMGPGEIINRSGLGFTVYNSRMLLKTLISILENENYLKVSTYDPNKFNFSIVNSSKALLKVLNSDI